VARLLKGGKSGPAIQPGDPDNSLLVQKIAAGEMPPKTKLAAYSVKPVDEHELSRIREWIAQGALQIDVPADMPNGEPDPLVSDEDRQFWAFRPPQPVAIPQPANASIDNPIDAFIAEELIRHGWQLQLSPPADRLTLLRRVYFDLLGLPPEPDVAQQFVADTDPLAYEKLVDRLLASPHYGERWGQHWLDLAGYSDSEGVQDSDPLRPHAYRYRDYVIRALNSDKPYDRFLLEQLAGDELVDYEHAPRITQEIYDNLVATGFLRMSSDGTFSGITGFVPDRLDVIDDQLRILGSAVMGLTIGCARCHSHKFDPIPQRDYYRLADVWKGAMDEHDWLKPIHRDDSRGGGDRYLPYVTTEEREAWEAQEKRLHQQLAPLQSQLAEAADEEQKKSLQTQIKELEAQRQPEPMIRALWDRGQPSPTYILRRGDYRSPTQLVGPGMPSVLSNGRDPLPAGPPWPDAEKTGRRLTFARQLTRPDHPLTARVLVNRLWKHHFGEGLVRTLDDFGRAGQPPSHPELLDWLAGELVRTNWSLKAMHRLMLTSATYRQSSHVTSEQQERDPENRLLGRMNMRKLEAESLRDTLLAVSGRLNRRPFGVADTVEARGDGLVTALSQHDGQRRSIYVQHRRTQPVSILATFDRPAMSPNCTARTESTVALQALHLLNNHQVHALSEDFAARIQSEIGDDPQRQIKRIHWLAYSRAPSAEELQLAADALATMRGHWEVTLRQSAQDSSSADVTRLAAQHALANYCHAVFNSAAFLFVD
jgi:hypothetical protein